MRSKPEFYEVSQVFLFLPDAGQVFCKPEGRSRAAGRVSSPRRHLDDLFSAAYEDELSPIDEARFLTLVEKAPDFALTVMRVLSRRLRMMDQRYHR